MASPPPAGPVSEPGTIIALHLSVGHRQPMAAVPEVHAVADLGLEGDRHARPGGRRQVLLMEAETLGELGLAPGDVRENITTAGLPLMDLAAGTRLRLGETVVLELTAECEPCARMDEVRPGLRKTLEGRRGVLARVLTGGRIRIGDPILVEAVALPVEDALDLHPFHPREVPSVVAEYLAQASAAGLGEVRLIHGRGQGVQRAAVRRVLGELPEVVAFDDAPPDRGGWGATVVRLRRPDP